MRGFVFSRESPAIDSILSQCNGVDTPLVNEKLPIAISRTVLQVFIYNLPQLKDVDAVCILDDDKRLPQGWTPFGKGMKEDGAQILIGRDLRTPPNPSIFSLRTNLLDLLYNLDLFNASGSRKYCIKSYCLAECCLGSSNESNMFDWYYDLSSSRMDHLEMPVYKDDFQADTPNKLVQDFLVGTPLCQDVISLEAGETSQRGGCMVIFNKSNKLDRNTKSFEPLALQQHAPVIHFSDGTTSHSRRSDSFWVKQLKSRVVNSVQVDVDKELFVYHDNRFDSIPSPSSIRKNVVQEVLGGILCRDVKWRKKYKDSRMLELKLWHARVKGLLRSLQNRHYCTDELIQSFSPFEEILDSKLWEQEVIGVVDSEFASLQEYEPVPTDFTKLNTLFKLKLGVAESKDVEKEWNRDRIAKAHKDLNEVTGEDGQYVGLGSEGVSFHVKDTLYKVFDLAQSRLPGKVADLLNSTYLDCPHLPPIMKRPYSSGTPYRGGHGMPMVQMLRKWKSMKLYHTNLTPANMVFDETDDILKIVDIGRDVKREWSEYEYSKHFRCMCKRAYLCYRFGECANNPYSLVQPKQWMREDEHSSPHLSGFEAFLRTIYDSDHDDKNLLEERLDGMKAVCGHVVSIADVSDDEVVDQINKAISQRMKENCHRISIVIEDPFHHNDAQVSKRRALTFYKRHLCRLHFPLEEHDIVLTDPNTFQEYVGYYIFVLDFNSALPHDRGCFLMIKSCPLEYKSILADVRRTVHCLESSTSFKSIVLVADVSKTDDFLRQYDTAVDIHAYNTALKQIEEERLVDHIVKFCGQDSQLTESLNEKWLGTGARSTHSLLGQHYASTFFGFESIAELGCYRENDVILQMDSDIILHCEKNRDDVRECIANFRDPNLLSFAFPILSKEASELHHLNEDGRPLRFQIRCSFVHLGRMLSMLPLRIPAQEVSSRESYLLERGWWHTLDINVSQTT